VLLGLQHEDAGALAEHEAVATEVPGREAAVGASLRFDSAIMLAKAAIGRGCTAASVPPTTTTSARPSRIMSIPSAIASLPDAHAETGVCTPALASTIRPTEAAGPLGISIGMASGETLRGPFSRRAS
jgi:hypothetical protein